jgi:glycosyltransferase involved in cell wall biosynthesis
MRRRGGIAAIAWAPCQRHAEDEARRLGACFYTIHYGPHRRPLVAPFKYVPQCLKTWWVLWRQQPRAVYVFISPVFAALSVAVYCRLAGVPFIMDVGGQALISRKWAWSVPLVRALARRARVNLVDQPRFQHLFASWGARTLLLERAPLADCWTRGLPAAPCDRFTVTLISTFSPDEPIPAALAAARRLPDIDFYVLGDTGLARGTLLADAPGNVTFTGYLTGDDYWQLLSASQVVMVLSTDRFSLCSGAVEGMALGKALILSQQPALTEYFSGGAVFVDGTEAGIVDGVRAAQAQALVLARQSRELAAVKRARWECEHNKIWSLLGAEA